MRRLLGKLELPLFARELTELAAKKRTYAIRVVYAAVLMWIGVAALETELQNLQFTRNGLGMLGSGRLLFSQLLVAQLIAVHIFMPALACAAVTAEKERNTLGLLLLTKLGPWRILFEKLFSRLLPMLTCLLLSVPILALSYTLGGVSLESIVTGTFLLLASCVQIGCLTLLCSTFYRTTVGSFIASYVAQIGIFFFVIILDESIGSYGDQPCLQFISGLAAWLNYTDAFSGGIFRGGAPPGSSLFEIIWDFLWIGFGICLSSVVFFVASRFFLIRRAVVVPRSRIMRLFKALDRIFVRVNDKLGGVTLVKDVGSLPGDEPIAWREVTKKSLGTARYLFRIFLVLELPTALICIIAAGSSIGGQSGTGLAGLSFFLWLVSAMILTIKASSLVATERASETLDVLLTTTMSSNEIIRQKCAGLKRVIAVIAVPLLTVIACNGYMQGFTTTSSVVYMVWGVLQVIVYLPLMAWVAIWIGLRVQTQTKGIFATMTFMLIWCALPGIIAWGFSVAHSDFGRFALQRGITEPLSIGATAVTLLPYSPLLLSGPTGGLAINELLSTRTSPAMQVGWFLIIPLHIAFFGTLWFLVRRRVLAIAGKKLGRGETPSSHVSNSNQSAAVNGFEPQHAIS